MGKIGIEIFPHCYYTVGDDNVKTCHLYNFTGTSDYDFYMRNTVRNVNSHLGQLDIKISAVNSQYGGTPLNDVVGLVRGIGFPIESNGNFVEKIPVIETLEFKDVKTVFANHSFIDLHNDVDAKVEVMMYPKAMPHEVAKDFVRIQFRYYKLHSESLAAIERTLDIPDAGIIWQQFFTDNFSPGMNTNIDYLHRIIEIRANELKMEVE